MRSGPPPPLPACALRFFYLNSDLAYLDPSQLLEEEEEEEAAAAEHRFGMETAKRTGRPPSKGRQRIEIRYITDKCKRQVTFSKRRKGLFKKAGELSQQCGAHVAVVVFSESGKPFAIGDPSVDDVLRAYVLLPGEEGAWLLHGEDDGAAAACRASVEATLRKAKETEARVEAEQARMKAIGEKVLQAVPAGKESWWDADVEQLGEEELPEFARALQRLRSNVQRHADKLSSAATPPPSLQ